MLVSLEGSLYNKTMISRRGILLFFAAILLMSSLSAVPRQQGGEKEFPGGISVRGEFYQFYQRAPDPERMFGSPISDAMADTMRQGIQVQYFERARMDYDPTKPAGQRVSLANLGTLTYNENQHGTAVDFSTNSNMCRAFQPSGYLVCYAFLQLYDSYKGQIYFGQPIANAEVIDGRLVQYFENVRMEWRSEMPMGQRVVLTELGRINYQLHGGTPPLGSGVVNNLSEMNVYAFTAHSVLSAGEQQQVFVVVKDNQTPLEGAQVMVTITYPDGRIESRRPAGQTNADGFTQDTFTVPSNIQPNQTIKILVEAEYPNGPKSTANTWFRIWW